MTPTLPSDAVTRAVSTTLDVERVSVWYTNQQNTKITCADSFERGPERHTSGIELALQGLRFVLPCPGGRAHHCAHDAHTDPRTSCFSEGYSKPLGINSMLDVPIRVGGSMVGKVRAEHIGPKRQWSKDEETFANPTSMMAAGQHRDATGD